MEKERRLYSLPELLELLPLSRTQSYREMAAGRLAYIQRGSRRYFEPEAVDAFIASMKDNTAVDRILALVDDTGRIDVACIPEDATLSDLHEARRLVAQRKQAA